MNPNLTFRNLIIFSCLLILGSCLSPIQENNPLSIATTSGVAQGTLKQSVISWEDIPYAIPPEGDLRWKAPRPFIAPNLAIQPQDGNGCLQEASIYAGIQGKGIVGQVINDKGLQETLLLSDADHVLPIVSGQYFCNAKGSGTPGKISCTYSSLIWPNKIIKGQNFYSSGLGGVYPRGILIGHVSKIENIDDTLVRLEINLVSGPIQENTFGVLEP